MAQTAPIPPRSRLLLFAGLALAALLLGVHEAWQGEVFTDAHVRQALLAGLVAASATAIGTLPVLGARAMAEETVDALLGFGAGVMLAASAFSLVVPALDAATTLGAGPWGAGGIVGTSILLGAGLLMAIDRLVPHEHFIKGPEGARRGRLRRAWLFVFAIALHNVPEGLAIGVAFASEQAVLASALTIGISLQNLPEGLIVAVALRSAGYSPWRSAGIGIASGLVEPVAAVAGAVVMGVSEALLPWGLAFAAGAMLFVISHEIIPESHRKGHERVATGGLIIGFALMTLLSSALG